MMRYVIMAALMALMASCSKDTEDKLEGKWQLQQVDVDGEVTQADTVFYNFQNRIFMYQIYRPAVDSTIYRHGFKTLEEDNRLTLELTDNPYGLGGFMPYTDWASPSRVFTIEKLSASQLILDSEGKRYLFRKF